MRGSITCPNASCRQVTTFTDDDGDVPTAKQFCTNCDTPLFLVPAHHGPVASSGARTEPRIVSMAAPPTGQLPPPTSVTCPVCEHQNVLSHDLDEIAHSSTEFCSAVGCDTPLFWQPNVRGPRLPSPDEITARYRMPGAGPLGQATLGSRACPACHERNLLKAAYCFRCGANMHPRKPPATRMASPVLVPVVVAPPPPAEDYTWLLVAILTTAITIAIALWLK